jgi:hypothetical protein
LTTFIIAACFSAREALARARASSHLASITTCTLLVMRNNTKRYRNDRHDTFYCALPSNTREEVVGSVLQVLQVRASLATEANFPNKWHRYCTDRSTSSR